MVTRLMGFAVVLLVAGALAARAEDPAPGTTEIHLTEQATRMMAPDRMSAALRFEAKGSDARQVQGDINRHMQAALAKAKTHPEITAQSGAYTVNRDYSVKDKERWQASQTLILTSKDFGALLALVGALQDDGMLVSDMHYELARETLMAAQSDLTASALASLKTRAGEVAQALGLRLDHFRTITVGNAGAPPMPGPRFNFTASAAPVPPPASQAADETVTLTVNADVILAKP